MTLKQPVTRDTYAIPVLFVVIALAIRLLATPWVDLRFPFLTFFIAVMAAAWHGGLVSGLIASALSILAADYFFLSPRYQFTIHQGELLPFVIFAIEVMGVSYLVDLWKRREAAVADSREQFRLLSDTVPALMSYVDTRERYQFCNQGYQDWFGLPHEQIIGQHMSTVLGEAAWKTVGPRIQEALAGHVVEYESEVSYTRGGKRWIHAVYTPHRDGRGQVAGVIVMVTDITSRKQGEEALRESYQRYELVLEGTEAAIWDWDVPRGNVVFSPRWKSMRGFSDEEVTDDLREWSNGIHPDDVPRVMAAVQAHMEGKTPFFSEEYRVRRKDGSWIWVADGGLARRDAAGRVIRMAGAEVDITERKRAEEAVHKLTVELEARVAKRTSELVQSHEQLRALATELNLTEHRERKRLATELHDHLAQLLVLARLKLGQAKQLPDLSVQTTDLLTDMEKVLSESLMYTRTLVADLSPPVLYEFGLAAALKWLAERMQAHHLRITLLVQHGTKFHVPEEQAVLLFQSVRELLMNAIKHGHVDEAIINVKTDRSRLVIHVQDQGTGFDPAIMTMQGAPSGEWHSKFGLFSIRERMAALGGSFEIVSAPGKGTTATMTIPLRQHVGSELPDGHQTSHLAGTALPAQAAMAPSSEIRVLLVDDHAMVRQGLRSLLESYPDIEVVGEASNGLEAVEQTGRVLPSVIVMDINMPEMNGIEATAKIRMRHPDIVVVGLSVNASGDNQDAMRAAGASVLLTKEAAVEQLHHSIQQAMRLAGRSRALRP